MNGFGKREYGFMVFHAMNVVLFHLWKYYDKLYGNIVYKMQTEMSNFIELPASLVFATISEF